MRRLLGVHVPDDAHGVLQDIHWAAGAFGYFPSYALGCLIAAQLWERMESELGAQDEALARGDVEAIRAWLGGNVHRHGRRLDTEALVGARDRRPDRRRAVPALRHRSLTPTTHGSLDGGELRRVGGGKPRKEGQGPKPPPGGGGAG